MQARHALFQVQIECLYAMFVLVQNVLISFHSFKYKLSNL